jgi:integrase
VLRVVKALWGRVPETASRVRGRIEAVLGWATVHHYRSGDNPARWQGLLEHALPARVRNRHHAALPYVEIGTFMRNLRQNNSVAARCLEMLVLTGTRLKEATNATWAEIDPANRMWTIPANRMKGGREHRVPLSDDAVAVLKSMQEIRHSDYIFPGMHEGRPVGARTIADIVKELAGREITIHGFRSTFRDWASERTNFPREVAEMALAHTIPSAVEAAYRRGDLFEKRRRLMDSWAAYCSTPAAKGEVVPIRR